MPYKGEKKQVVLPKIHIIGRKIHLLSNNSLLPQKTGYYQKEQVMKEKKIITSLSKKNQHRITQKNKAHLLPNLLAFLGLLS